MTLPFASRFLAGDARATALLPDAFRRREAWRAEAAARAGQRVHPSLLVALAEQQARLPPSAARDANLLALGQPGTVCVVSGQQVGLFLGPLYTFYKAASAIVWARAVESETGQRCVPVFWLQTEDHDFAEIASCEVPDPPGPSLKLSLPDCGSRCSVEHVPLPAEVGALVDQLAAALGKHPFADEIVPLVRAAYVPGRSVTQAFAELVAAVFADEGLLVLNPRCREVAQLASPLYAQAIARAAEVDAALLHRGAQLEQAGLREQVHVRPGSPLVFFHADGALGARRRLTRKGDGYQLDGEGEQGRVTIAQLLEAAEREPLRFSSSALFRPVVQDALLPVVAYIGGPAELGYLAQTAPLYTLFNVRPSIPAPRARFRLLEPRTVANLEKLGLTAAQVEVPRARLLEHLGAQQAGRTAEQLSTELLGALPAQVRAMGHKHQALAKAVRRTELTIERAVARLSARHARLLAEEDKTLQERADKLQEALYPGGAPQERVHSLPFYAARHGLAALKAAVLAAVEPGESAVRDLRP